VDNPKEILTDLFFPKFCLGCQKEGTYLCQDCRSLLDILEYNYCLCETHPVPLPFGSDGKCQKCKDKKLSGLYFALSFKEGALTKKLIHQFKYPPYLKDLAETLAGILAEHFILTQKNTNEFWGNSVFIPIPLAEKKLKERGYNQSEELAKELAEILKIPVISDVLIKIKNTKPQAESKKEEREKNLLGAFAVNKNCAVSEAAQFSRIYLVDDVYTTGATMEECARVLRDSGAKSVWGIALAREG
jgi:ComF family protein